MLRLALRAALSALPLAVLYARDWAVADLVDGPHRVSGLKHGNPIFVEGSIQ